MSFIEKLTAQINSLFEVINTFLAKIIFFDVFFFLENIKFPFVVFFLFICGLFFTFKMGFVNIRLFRHSLLMAFGFWIRVNKNMEKYLTLKP